MPPMGGMGGLGSVGSPPGMPRPGQGMDPMAAMMGGLGGSPPGGPPGMGVNGPDGLPLGGAAPPPGSPDEMGGSDLMSMLSQGGDQYDQPPGSAPFTQMGQPPDDGMQQLMQMLAFAQMGVQPDDGMGGMGGGGMGCPPGMPC